MAALKDATIIKTKKADWRLVAAAQAMLRGQHSDEFDAAQAFGKTIKQRREVSHWSDKLRELEQMRSLLLGVTTSGELSNGHSSSSLLVQPEWIAGARFGRQGTERLSAHPLTWEAARKARPQRAVNSSGRLDASCERRGQLHLSSTRG